MNKIYKKEKQPWGDKPKPIVVNNIDKFKKGNVLDLGCGTGNEAIFLAKKGFNVTAVDYSPKAIEIIKENIKGTNFETNINIVEQDVFEFIQKNKDKKWDNVISFFTLHFLKSKEAVEVYKLIKENTLSDGLNVFRDFTTRGALNTLKGYYFESNELKRMYKDWDIIMYDESPGLTKDGGQHMIASLVAKKPL